MPPDLKSIGEFGLIRRLANILSSQKLPLNWQGIGDDTAVIPVGRKKSLLFSHDLLLEKAHFLCGTLKDFRDLGWKALAVNLSDVAAMGGRPLAAVVGLGLPRGTEVKQVEALYRGLRDCGRRFSCPILGGDTNQSRGGWMISVTVLGEAKARPILRSGARSGDELWVTGELGGAALAWQAWEKGQGFPTGSPFQGRLNRPEPRLAWGQLLAKSKMLSAMIDISDGLAGDLGHLSEAGKVGFRVDVAVIPRPKGFPELCRKKKISELRTLLSGGEDYELLFTVKQEKGRNFSRWLKRQNIAATRIGEATRGERIEFRNRGSLIKEKFQGYCHFKQKRH